MSADDIMLSWGRVSPTGMCYRTCYRAGVASLGADFHGADPRTATSIDLGAFEPMAGRTDYAWAAWQSTPAGRKHTDRHPPKGALVYFGPNHVTLSRGNGLVVTTDFPAYTITERSIEYIEQSYGPYWGWTDWLAGHDLHLSGFAGDIEEDPLMAFTEADLRRFIREESAAIIAGHDDQIVGFFRDYLGRDPSPDERSARTWEIATEGIDVVRQRIAASPEAQARRAKK